MSLRVQLLAIGLLTLILPWAGLRFVEEMEGALRSTLEASLQGSVGTVAGALERQLGAGRAADLSQARSTSGSAIFAHPLRASPELDGRRDDWGLAPTVDLAFGPAQRVVAGTHERFAYLVIEIDDDDVVYQRLPGRPPHGDRIVLLLENAADPPRWLLLLSSAPGGFRAEYTEPPLFAPLGRFEDRVVGSWAETRSGFSVEVRVPLGLVDTALGVAVVDVDESAAGYVATVAATWDSQGEDAGPFVYRNAEIQMQLEQFGRAGNRFRVLDGDGWVIADTGRVVPTPTGASGGLAERFFRYVLERDDVPYTDLERPMGRIADAALREALTGEVAVAWYREGPDGSAIVAAAAPMRAAGGEAGGAVLLEQASDPILTLTNRALLELVMLTLVASLVVTLTLLGYASFLSFRIRRLARATESALGPEGTINVALPGGAARDELGDLTRSFGISLARVRDYTEYLRTLAAKLTHELRTPLAIVSTSLDNLEHEAKDPGAAPYLARLRDGTARLDSILVAMSAATRIEQAITETQAEDFDLGHVVRTCATAYQDVYRDRVIACEVPAGAALVRGSSELVAQLLDKLVENAASFSPVGSTIALEVAETAEAFVLGVTNLGPPLPATMRNQLFDSLVSVRAHGDGRPHLGLGLYIVALIAKFHAASVTADDLRDGSGVVFRVHFPVGAALAAILRKSRG
jgi:dedicated sortase system histidine kinase